MCVCVECDIVWCELGRGRGIVASSYGKRAFKSFNLPTMRKIATSTTTTKAATLLGKTVNGHAMSRLMITIVRLINAMRD